MRPVVAALAALVFAWSAPADARSFRVQDIPNGDVFTCLSCHGELEARTFTPFGSHARARLEETGPIQNAHVIWAELCPLDSDGDGRTNGEELNDPNCTWTRSMSDPGGSVTNPGQGGPGAQVCGNGKLDDGEECEGDNLDVTECLALDYGIGKLACQSDCTYDYSDCSKPPPGWEPSDDGGLPAEESGCAAAGGASPGGAALALAVGLMVLARRRRTA